MKPFLFLTILLSLLNTASATNYYFSSVSGDDSRTSKQAQDQTTPWKSITKLNAIFKTLQPGDSVLLKRGETFYGGIIINKSGTSSAPIVISAFGTGAKPVITGGVEVTSWTSLGDGVWESTHPISTSISKVNIVTSMNVPAQIGRHPNVGVNAPGITNGWLKIKGNGNKQIIDKDSSNFSKTWLGAEIVLKPIRHIIDRGTINDINSNSITYNGGSSYSITNGNGYFFQNHPSLLDQVGEWYFNPYTNKLRIQNGDNAPTNVKVSTLNTVVDLNKKSFINFDNVEFSYGNAFGAEITDAKDIIFNNCKFLYNMDAIYGLVPMRITVNNCDFNHNLDDAIYLHRPSGNTPATMNVSTQHVITNNTINNTGMIAGMGRSGDSKYDALAIFGANNLIQYNTIKNTGFCPIVFYWGDNTKVFNNYIDSFSLVKNDAGGIYTWNNSAERKGGSDTAISYKGERIENNIILNGIGDFSGTTEKNSLAMGIYFDHRVGNVTVKNNTVYNCFRGFFFLSSYSDTLLDNTFYANRERQIDLNYDLDSDHGHTMRPVRNMLVKNNIFFSKTGSQTIAMFRTISDHNDIAQWGTFDDNYYARPLGKDSIVRGIFHQFNKGAKQINAYFDFKGWKSKFGKEANSLLSSLEYPADAAPDSIFRFEYNATKFNKKITLTKAYYDVKNVRYTDSVILAPYTSVVLMLDPSAPAKKKDLEPSISITSPKINSTFATLSNITINADAKDPENAIEKVEFFSGTTLIKTVKHAPYTYTWNKVASGTYTITAKVYDGAEHVVSSTPVLFTVQANVAPVVSITSPKVNASYNVPASVQLTATASDVDGKVTKVEFYNGSTLIKTEYTAPYDWTWKNVKAGTYKLTAKATDNNGNVSSSEVVTFTVGSKNHRLSSATPEENTDTTTTNTISSVKETSVNNTSNVVNALNFNLFPNPAINNLKVQFNVSTKDHQVTLVIRNLSGIIVKSLSLNFSGNVIEVDISSLKTGMYILSVSGKDFMMSKQFLKN